MCDIQECERVKNDVISLYDPLLAIGPKLTQGVVAASAMAGGVGTQPGGAAGVS